MKNSFGFTDTKGNIYEIVDDETHYNNKSRNFLLPSSKSVLTNPSHSIRLLYKEIPHLQDFQRQTSSFPLTKKNNNHIFHIDLFNTYLSDSSCSIVTLRNKDNNDDYSTFSSNQLFFLWNDTTLFHSVLYMNANGNADDKPTTELSFLYSRFNVFGTIHLHFCTCIINHEESKITLTCVKKYNQYLLSEGKNSFNQINQKSKPQLRNFWNKYTTNTSSSEEGEKEHTTNDETNTSSEIFFQHITTYENLIFSIDNFNKLRVHRVNEVTTNIENDSSIEPTCIFSFTVSNSSKLKKLTVKKIGKFFNILLWFTDDRVVILTLYKSIINDDQLLISCRSILYLEPNCIDIEYNLDYVFLFYAKKLQIYTINPFTPKTDLILNRIFPFPYFTSILWNTQQKKVFFNQQTISSSSKSLSSFLEYLLVHTNFSNPNV